jgi:hypothetical protein
MVEFLAWFVLLFPFFAIAAHTVQGFIDDYRERRR